jgi:hypothetical protein
MMIDWTQMDGLISSGIGDQRLLKECDGGKWACFMKQLLPNRG